MASPPPDFGKRKPAVAPVTSSPPVKRSGHVALLVMGTMAVGGGAYALMPRENCQPASPSAVAGPSPPISGVTGQPAPAPVTSCGSRTSSGGHGGSGSWWSHSSYYGGSSSSGTSGGAGSTTTTRGGFGSFAHMFSGGG
ncbi:MAG TPA: hypothetical protein VFL62_10040 [Bradyrhizobium sp.]|uniref:hypothetical protein n=1 Tax=Bradyrhizobium sp. TaxID=376 RepID=UPI002D7EF4F2|nr:hypothetical protein [Bradyrhizobium sp.]HET7886554.1 hypothetical protein [Bradyrhizobium sp.]